MIDEMHSKTKHLFKKMRRPRLSPCFSCPRIVVAVGSNAFVKVSRSEARRSVSVGATPGGGAGCERHSYAEGRVPAPHGPHAPPSPGAAAAQRRAACSASRKLLEETLAKPESSTICVGLDAHWTSAERRELVLEIFALINCSELQFGYYRYVTGFRSTNCLLLDESTLTTVPIVAEHHRRRCRVSIVRVDKSRRELVEECNCTPPAIVLPSSGGYWADGLDDDEEERRAPDTPRHAAWRYSIDTDDTAKCYRRFFLGKAKTEPKIRRARCILTLQRFGSKSIF
ncbi:hypothetical protein EVAR_100570_1 [Eumeta japonica]|uniref:Uncharacterized protein n=1 Tax=Eumeta variegata TaxID=151549 RepID=A0A4C1YFU5_EUMVA|nr:hypothetical protein EVAR_100570_1 [Eumeta japonica]